MILQLKSATYCNTVAKSKLILIWKEDRYTQKFMQKLQIRLFCLSIYLCFLLLWCTYICLKNANKRGKEWEIIYVKIVIDYLDFDSSIATFSGMYIVTKAICGTMQQVWGWKNTVLWILATRFCILYVTLNNSTLL